MAIRINGVDHESTADYRDKWSGDSTRTYGSTGDASSAKGTYHLADNPHIYEIQRTNNFEFVVNFDVDGLGNTVSNILEASGLKDGDREELSTSYMQEVVRLSVSQASIPHFSQEPIEIKRGNSSIKYAGVPTFNEGSLTCNDYIGADTLAVLAAWQNLSYNVATEKVGLASDYKKTATLIEYTPDMQVVRTWTLYGCWIRGLSEGDFDSDNNSKHTITVNISYDRAVINNDGLGNKNMPTTV